MAHLLSLADLGIPEVNKILNRAGEFSHGASSKAAEDKVIASLFLSPARGPSSPFPWRPIVWAPKC